MKAYQTTVTTTGGRHAVGHVVYATEAYMASLVARQGVSGVIGTEVVAL